MPELRTECRGGAPGALVVKQTHRGVSAPVRTSKRYDRGGRKIRETYSAGGWSALCGQASVHFGPMAAVPSTRHVARRSGTVNRSPDTGTAGAGCRREHSGPVQWVGRE